MRIPVITTIIPIRLLLFTLGTRIATKRAYNAMLKLLVTITGRKSRSTTPIAAPKTQDRKAIPARPMYIQIELSSRSEKIAKLSSTTR